MRTCMWTGGVNSEDACYIRKKMGHLAVCVCVCARTCACVCVYMHACICVCVRMFVFT